MGFGMDFHFDGGNFVVVGASSGIGKKIAQEIFKGGRLSENQDLAIS